MFYDYANQKQHKLNYVHYGNEFAVVGIVFRSANCKEIPQKNTPPPRKIEWPTYKCTYTNTHTQIALFPLFIVRKLLFFPLDDLFHENIQNSRFDLFIS